MDCWCDFWVNSSIKFFILFPSNSQTTCQQTNNDLAPKTIQGRMFMDVRLWKDLGSTPNDFLWFRDEVSIKLFFYAISICYDVQLHHNFITTSQQTEETTNRYVTTNFSAHVVVTFSVISIFQLRIANWPNHPCFGLAECARRVSIDIIIVLEEKGVTVVKRKR